MLCAVCAGVAFAGKPVPPSPIDVTSIVFDQATSGNSLSFQADDPNHTSQASYTNTGSVASTVGQSGGWGLDLFNQVARTVCLTFSTADGSKPVVPNGCYSENVEIYSRCYDAHGTEIGFLTIQVGVPQSNCLFSFDFGTGRTKYKMAMGQNVPSSPAGPPSGFASVTCNAANGTACMNWTIVPNTGALNPLIANLYIFGHSGNLQYLGQYILSYRINVTNP